MLYNPGKRWDLERREVTSIRVCQKSGQEQNQSYAVLVAVVFPITKREGRCCFCVSCGPFAPMKLKFARSGNTEGSVIVTRHGHFCCAQRERTCARSLLRRTHDLLNIKHLLITSRCNFVNASRVGTETALFPLAHRRPETRSDLALFLPTPMEQSRGELWKIPNYPQFSTRFRV